MAFGRQKQAFNLTLWSQDSDKVLFKTAFWFVTLLKSACAACGLHASDYIVFWSNVLPLILWLAVKKCSQFNSVQRTWNQRDVHIKKIKYEKKTLIIKYK